MDGILNTDDTTIPSPLAAAMNPAIPLQQPQATQGGLSGFAQNNGDLLLRMAGAYSQGTPMGNAFKSAADHFQFQDQLKSKRDAQAAVLKLKQDQLDETKRLNDAKTSELRARTAKEGAPKVVPLSGGAFTQVSWPSGYTTVVPNDKVQDFLFNMQDKKTETAMTMAGLKADITPPSAAEQKLGQDTRKDLDSIDQQISRFKNAGELIGKSGAPEWQGLPLVSSIGQMIGTDAAGVQQKLSELKVDQAFADRAKGQGAITDFERNILMAPLPKDFADTKLWQQYITDKIAILDKIRVFQANEVAKVDKPRNGLATAQTVIEARKKPLQNYPGKAGAAFAASAPSNGRAPAGDQLKILQDELAAEIAKPDSPDKVQNVAAIQREIKNAGGTVAAPAAPVRPPLTSFKR